MNIYMLLILVFFVFSYSKYFLTEIPHYKITRQYKFVSITAKSDRQINRTRHVLHPKELKGVWYYEWKRK